MHFPSVTFGIWQYGEQLLISRYVTEVSSDQSDLHKSRPIPGCLSWDLCADILQWFDQGGSVYPHLSSDRSLRGLSGLVGPNRLPYPTEAFILAQHLNCQYVTLVHLHDFWAANLVSFRARLVGQVVLFI